LVHLQVVGREQMAIAADIGYGHGLEDTFQGKAHDISFGCSKARPRYHLQRFAPSCTGLPRRAVTFRSPRPDDRMPTVAYLAGTCRPAGAMRCNVTYFAADFSF
jgi:hypothetical protein